MFVFLFISTYICGLYANFYNADKEIYPNETLVFINIVNEDNEQFSLTVRNITKEKGLRISIEEPKNDVNTSPIIASLLFIESILTINIVFATTAAMAAVSMAFRSLYIITSNIIGYTSAYMYMFGVNRIRPM